ncbi:MAG TPA: hypothetical protein VHA55_07400 [Pseudorhodoplanes sp.]|nr:hypothetical protein [Pseudorhodoplanes sp.]
MRFILLATLFLFAAVTSAQAAGCPKDPTRASLAVWPPNSIRTGSSVTGVHPCGRAITCTGGVPNEIRTRSCRWK